MTRPDFKMEILDLARKLANDYIEEYDGYLHQLKIDEEKVNDMVRGALEQGLFPEIGPHDKRETNHEFHEIAEDDIRYVRREFVDCLKAKRDNARRNLIPYGV